MLLESVIVAGVGVVVGLAVSAATVVPFALARDEGVAPNGQVWLSAVVATALVLLTFGAARLGVHRALATGGLVEVVA